MSDYMSDIGKLYSMNGSSSVAASSTAASKSTNKKAGAALEMEDYLSLMVATLKNQTIDDTADMSEMMSQMVQMSLVSAITEISALVSDSSVMTYAASLVGKEVTVARYDDNGNLIETLGTVTGTGTLNGQQVIFLDDDKSYYLTDILAVGRLPERDANGNIISTKPSTDKVEETDELEPADEPENTDRPEETTDTDKTDAPQQNDKTPETNTTENNNKPADVTQDPQKTEEAANAIHDAVDETVKHGSDNVQAASQNAEMIVNQAQAADSYSHAENTEI